MNHKELMYHIQQSSKFILLYFWHDTCAPCKVFKPLVNKVIDAYDGKIELIPVDVTEDRETAMLYSIRNVPTLILIRNGTTLGFNSGTLSQNELLKFLQQNMIGK